MLKNSIVLVFLGPDGAGKSTYINMLENQLKKKKIVYKSYHLIPNFFKSKKSIVVSNPHSKKKRSKIFSFLKLLYWLIKTQIFTFFDKHISKQIIMFDRYAYDVLIDPVRYRFNLDVRLTKYILSLFPKPNLLIIVTNKPSIIWKRKKEIKYKILVQQLKKYNFLKNKYNNSIFCKDKKDIKKILNTIKKEYEI